MRKTLRIAASGVLALSLSMAGLSATAHADTGGLTATQIQSAVSSTVGGFNLPSLSDEVTTTTDANSAAISTVNNVTVDIPKAASAGVTMTANGQSIGIDLPNTSGTQTGTVTAPGIVSYPTASGDTANAVQTEDGAAARFLTIIKDANAPEEFEYNLHLPEGSSITKEDDGSLKVAISGSDDGYVIAPPWAHDANGAHVWTQWFTDGESTIDLVVNHHGENVAYPITADPWISWGWTGYTLNLNRDDTRYVAQGVMAGIAARIGGWKAAAVGASGGQWLADYAYRRGLCLKVWVSYYNLGVYPYVGRC